ncbi:Retrovirus-related Pol poly from transposon [Paramuricea clavata]|uniref:Retrovirus-related Pol poly from transposon n=1 Tax=Paramuricea clavata TaxID=317549 RepID=A0A7D9IJJ3_PARCT|nr:Retrovirus-related Pol poly from transposon [Paramuricea clavata]
MVADGDMVADGVAVCSVTWSNYWNVTQDEESSYLTTLNSPFGRCRFKRMPFGLKMSQDVFQSKIDQTLESCNGVVEIADDIVVFGKTAEEHVESPHVIVHTDHKTLEGIHLKHLTSSPPRLQRMLLRLQTYDLTIKYIPRKDMLLADALSRLSPEEKNPVKDMNVEIHEVCPQFSSEMIQKEKPKRAEQQQDHYSDPKADIQRTGNPGGRSSDNGPHYSSNDYRECANEYGFQIETSSPHYPRSNGYIESQVKTVKAILAKAKKTETDPNIALLCLRSTPIDNALPSPAELFMKRKIQDNLPRKITRGHNSDDIITRL